MVETPLSTRRNIKQQQVALFHGRTTFAVIQVAQERAVRAAARREDKVKAFRGWSRLKAVTEAAVRCLQDIDAPTEKAAETRAQECWLEVRENETR